MQILYFTSLAGLLIVYSPVFYFLYDAWNLDPYYSHGFIVPVVSIFLVWSSRKELMKSLAVETDYPAIFVIIGILLYIVAIILDFRFLMYLSFIVSLGGVILFIWGSEVLKILLFPLCYLLLMFPLPYSITSAIAFPLQIFSSKSSVLLLNLLDISALQEGVNIHIPGFSFIIERGCSGLQSIVALFTLAVLFAYLARGPIKKRIFLVFSSIPIALIANILRITIVILVAKAWGREAAESFFHTFSSLFLFSMAFLLLTGTAKFIGCLPQKK